MLESRIAPIAYREQATWSERIRRYAGEAFSRWRARRTAAALEELDDEILKDVGISRHEIPAIALKATRKRVPSHNRSRTREGRKGE